MTQPTLTKREQAAVILAALFPVPGTRVPIADVRAAGAEAGVSYRTFTRASKDFGIVEIHNGPLPGFWERRT